MLKVRADAPLNPVLVDLIRQFHKLANRTAGKYFLIGATARDILFTNVMGIVTDRATRDVDFAVAVPTWPAFEKLKADLVASGHFMATKHVQQLLFRDHQRAFQLDLVPFSGVESNGRIAWPPDGAIVMNVAGYDDALRSAVLVEIEAGLQVKVISIPALVALKILAWNDQPAATKHARDVLFLLRSYHHAGQQDRLYDAHIDLLQGSDFDIEMAGAALLGRDTRELLSRDVIDQVSAVLAAPSRRNFMLAQMGRASVLDVQAIEHLIDLFHTQLRALGAHPSP